jgi:DNA-binding NarL/FixJ family response regulator
MARVVIADSSLINRWAIRRALAQAPEARIVGEAQNARQVMAAIRRARAQALIVDAKILSGWVPLIKAIAQEQVPLVLLGDSSDPEERALIGQVLAAGAARVLPRMPLPSSANFAPAAARLIAAVRPRWMNGRLRPTSQPPGPNQGSPGRRTGDPRGSLRSRLPPVGHRRCKNCSRLCRAIFPFRSWPSSIWPGAMRMRW